MTLLKLPSYWYMPPKSDVLVIGLLAETTNVHRLLAVTDYYWGSHEDLDKYLRQHYSIARDLWSGEMLISNDKDRRARGSILFSINTSGYLTERIANAGAGSADINDPMELKQSLDDFRPDLITPYTQYFKFDRDHAHLDLFFQDLYRRVQYSPTDTVRHRFRNVLNVLHTLSYYFNGKTSGAPQADLQLLQRISSTTVNDMLLLMESRTRFSAFRSSTGKRGERAEKLRDLRKRQMLEEKDFMTLIDLIKTNGPRVTTANLEPEVIDLTDGSR